MNIEPPISKTDVLRVIRESHLVCTHWYCRRKAQTRTNRDISSRVVTCQLPFRDGDECQIFTHKNQLWSQ